MNCALFASLIFCVSSVQCLDLLENPIYDLILSDSTKCYSCYGDNCATPTVAKCARSSQCFSRTIAYPNETIQSKGCIEPSETVCNSEDGCFTCDGDLCNRETPVDLGVKSCYTCIDECSNPPAQHDCQQALTTPGSEPVKAACLTFKVTREGQTTISKGCIADDLLATCAALTLTNLGRISCSMCRSELCNTENDWELQDPVDQCYFCQNDCAVVEVQNCAEALGEGANSKCIALEQTVDGVPRHTRGCTEYTDKVQSTCDLVNQQGGNCTICESDLCNHIHKEEVPVGQCYHCVDNCDNMEVKSCELGPDAIAKCIAIEHNNNNETTVRRECVEVDSALIGFCEDVNNQGGRCTICEDDLCNGVFEEYVSECYFCDLVCSDPLEIETCEGRDSKCVALELGQGEEKYEKRGCSKIDENFKSTCRNIQIGGGNCTECSSNLCNHKTINVPDGGSSNAISFQLYLFLTILFALIL